MDVPAVVSGDVTSRAQAQAILATTGASAVMVGRAAQGNPWATGFLKKFYGWYLSHGRFPPPFKQELVQLETLAEVETRLLAAAPGADQIVARLESEVHEGEDDVVPDLPISMSAAVEHDR